jgi:hypothetical protein
VSSGSKGSVDVSYPEKVGRQQRCTLERGRGSTPDRSLPSLSFGRRGRPVERGVIVERGVQGGERRERDGCDFSAPSTFGKECGCSGEWQRGDEDEAKTTALAGSRIDPFESIKDGIVLVLRYTRGQEARWVGGNAKGFDLAGRRDCDWRLRRSAVWW